MTVHDPDLLRSPRAALVVTGLDFLAAHGLSPHALEQAERMAAECGVPPIDALVRTGLAEEEAVYRALAAELGVEFLEVDQLAIHRRARFPQNILAGAVPLGGDAEIAAVAIAPRGENFASAVLNRDRLPGGVVVTTPTSLSRALIWARTEQVADLAANGLARTTPHLSYRDGLTRGQAGLAAVMILGLSVATLEAPGTTWLCVTAGLSLALLGATSLRIAAASEPVPIAPPPGRNRVSDRDLPVYTILVPLFREAAVLSKLVAALAALDYPAVKLDIKLLLESNDVETREALARTKLPAFMEVVVVPPGEPRTKPRALNVGLAIAWGEYLVVYDAEDVPDSDQLRLAVDFFSRSEPDVACLQARLAIDNTNDTLLTRGLMYQVHQHVSETVT